jgi:hypothetical protein
VVVDSWDNRAMNRTIERVRAVLRLISPDDITPMGVRMIEKVLDEEEKSEKPAGPCSDPP